MSINILRPELHANYVLEIEILDGISIFVCISSLDTIDIKRKRKKRTVIFTI